MNTIILTEQDLISASKLNFIRTRAYRIASAKTWRYILIGIIILSFCFNLYINKQTLQYEFIHFLSSTVVISFFILYLPVFLILVTKFNTKLAWKKSKILRIPYTLKWDESYLFIKSNQTKTQVEWHFFCNLVQNERYVLAYYCQNCFYLIPKRFFENSEEIQDFLNHLEVGIKKIKKIPNNRVSRFIILTGFFFHLLKLLTKNP